MGDNPFDGFLALWFGCAPLSWPRRDAPVLKRQPWPPQRKAGSGIYAVALLCWTISLIGHRGGGPSRGGGGAACLGTFLTACRSGSGRLALVGGSGGSRRCSIIDGRRWGLLSTASVPTFSAERMGLDHAGVDFVVVTWACRIPFGISSAYLSNFGSYNEVYGVDRVRVVAMMMWLYISAYLVLFRGQF